MSESSDDRPSEITRGPRTRQSRVWRKGRSKQIVAVMTMKAHRDATVRTLSRGTVSGRGSVDTGARQSGTTAS
jgi:hypothetical protein